MKHLNIVDYFYISVVQVTIKDISLVEDITNLDKEVLVNRTMVNTNTTTTGTLKEVLVTKRGPENGFYKDFKD